MPWQRFAEQLAHRAAVRERHNTNRSLLRLWQAIPLQVQIAGMNNSKTALNAGITGQDAVNIHSWGTLNIREFSKGNDFKQLGEDMTYADVELIKDGFIGSTSFKKSTKTLAMEYGNSPTTSPLPRGQRVSTTSSLLDHLHSMQSSQSGELSHARQ